MMRDRWNNLNLREKQMLSLGSLVIVSLLIYFFLWSPLDSSVSNLRNQIEHDQELLTWMQDANKQIQSIGKTSAPTLRPKGSLLSTIQKEVNRSPLAKNLNQLHQADNDSVQVSFQKVNFDQLMIWLIDFSKRENLTITQIVITPSHVSGIVTADLILKEG